MKEVKKGYFGVAKVVFVPTGVNLEGFSMGFGEKRMPMSVFEEDL